MTRAARRAACALALVGLAACSGSEAPPRAQWLVSIATNAPSAPFFDRMLVEILDDEGNLACGAGCRRSFLISDATAWPIEIGVTGSAAPTHVRARIHRADHVAIDGLPLAPMLIDVMGRLPPADGITRVALLAPMECFGVASDPQAHTACDPVRHALGDEPTLGPANAPLLQPRTWAPAAKVDCRGDVPAGMVCVPGGAFFFGKVFAASTVLKTSPEHLVQLSPFALDVDEMTVGAVRQLVASGTVKEPPASPDPDPQSADHPCTWAGAQSAANDALPINCVRRGLAELICDKLGKRLPTEAEIEWASGNTTLETDYPWGGDPDACARAIVGRGRTSTETRALESPACRSATVPAGLVPGGHPRDVTALGVKNLAGSLSEWAADKFFADYSDPCWGSPTSLSVDPRCDLEAPRLLTAAVARGGSWSNLEIQARAIARGPKISTASHLEWAPDVGFRCAKSM